MSERFAKVWFDSGGTIRTVAVAGNLRGVSEIGTEKAGGEVRLGVALVRVVGTARARDIRTRATLSGPRGDRRLHMPGNELGIIDIKEAV